MEKRNMRRIIAGFMAAATMLSISACSSSSGNATSKAANSTSGQAVKITVWTNNGHDSTYMKKKVAEFNKKNTGSIQVDYVVHSDNYGNLITMSAASGQTPDVMSINASDHLDLKTYVDSGIIQEITPFLTDDFKKTTALDSNKYEGLNVIGSKVYWVPTILRSGNRLIYNKDLFKNAGVKSTPKTLDEIVQDAKIITSYGKGKQYGVVVPGQSGAFDRMIEPIAEVSGIYPYNYKEGKYDFSGYKPILEAFHKMFADGSMLPGAASMKVDPTRVQFAAGNVGMYGNASQEVGVLTEQFPAKCAWGVAEMPSVSGTVKGALSDSPQLGWMMSAKTSHAKEAWKVIEYFSSLDFVKGYAEEGLGVPISDYIYSKVNKSKIGRMTDFKKLDYESVYPIFPSVTPQGEAYDVALWNACVSGTNLDAVITKLNKTYNNALNQAVKLGKVKRLVIKNFDPLHPNKGTAQYLAA
jgi:multiple sugar transport system substrate-binding protein